MSAHVTAHLSAYLDRELEPAERQVVETHLGQCEECSSRLVDLAAVDELARGLPLEVPAGYFETLPARVRFKVTPRRRLAPRLPAWSWAVAAALLVAVVTPALLERTPKPAEVARGGEPASAQPSPAGGRDVPAGRRDEKEQAGGLPTQSLDSRADSAKRAKPAYDELASSPKKVASAAPPPAPPAAPAPVPAGGGAPGRLAENRAAPLAKAEEATAKDKAREASPELGRAQDAPAASAAFAAPPDAGPLEGAAGQHLYEPEAEGDATDSQAAAGESKRARSAQGSAAGTLRDADARRSSPAAPRLRFRVLEAQVPGNATDARLLREQWRAFLAQDPPVRQADEARVRMVETGVQAWRLSNDPADLIRARRDGEEYLLREDAAQGSRVRALLSTLGN